MHVDSNQSMPQLRQFGGHFHTPAYFIWKSLLETHVLLRLLRISSSYIRKSKDNKPSFLWWAPWHLLFCWSSNLYDKFPIETSASSEWFVFLKTRLQASGFTSLYWLPPGQEIFLLIINSWRQLKMEALHVSGLGRISAFQLPPTIHNPP